MRAGASGETFPSRPWPSCTSEENGGTGDPNERAGASLRSAWFAPQGSGPRGGEGDRPDLDVADDLVVDVHTPQALARRLIDRDALPCEIDIGSAAVSALSQDLLPDRYDDWALFAAEDWRQLRLHALEVVVTRLTAAGRLAEATTAARAAVQAEPLRERARAALIRVHLAGGNQSDAHGEFERYRVLLHAELGLEPTPRLSELFSDLEPRYPSRRGA